MNSMHAWHDLNRVQGVDHVIWLAARKSTAQSRRLVLFRFVCMFADVIGCVKLARSSPHDKKKISIPAPVISDEGNSMTGIIKCITPVKTSKKGTLWKKQHLI